MTNFDLSRLEGNILFNTLLSIVKEEEGEAAQTSPASGVATLDAAQLRTELAAHGPRERAIVSSVPVRSSLPGPARAEAPALVAQQIEVGVMRTALDDERARTSALRRDFDEAHIALESQAAEAEALQVQLAALGREVELLRRHRDIWAERARAMAAMMVREPDEDEGNARKAA